MIIILLQGERVSKKVDYREKNMEKNQDFAA